jgi:hypothetical protein
MEKILVSNYLTVSSEMINNGVTVTVKAENKIIQVPLSFHELQSIVERLNIILKIYLSKLELENIDEEI